MKKIILILGLFLLTTTKMLSIDIYKQENGMDGDTITNIETLRNYRFIHIKNNPYKDDIDCRLIGNTYIIFNKIDNKKKELQDKIKKTNLNKQENLNNIKKIPLINKDNVL